MINCRLAGLILRSTACLSAALLAGCAARQPGAKVWRLDGRDQALVLHPPRPPGPTFTLKDARSTTTRGPACALQTREVTLQWKGRAAHVRADSRPLVPTPGSLVTADGRQSFASDTVVAGNWFRQDFLPGLERQQAAGCLAGADIPALAGRVIDNLELPTPAAYRLRYGEYAMSGYIDVDAKFRLAAVEPIRENGAVVGYRTSYYPLRLAPGGGVVVERGISENNIPGRVTHGEAVDSELLHLPPAATYLRLFFRTWNLRGDRRIAVLAAGDREALEQGTRAFDTNPEAYCAGAAAHGVACVGVPVDTVIGPELQVLANGRALYVPVGGSVADLLRAAGVRDFQPVVAKLRIRKPYEGRLVPVDTSRAGDGVLGFVFLGGEQVTW